MLPARRVETGPSPLGAAGRRASRDRGLTGQRDTGGGQREPARATWSKPRATELGEAGRVLLGPREAQDTPSWSTAPAVSATSRAANGSAGSWTASQRSDRLAHVTMGGAVVGVEPGVAHQPAADGQHVVLAGDETRQGGDAPQRRPHRRTRCPPRPAAPPAHRRRRGAGRTALRPGREVVEEGAPGDPGCRSDVLDGHRGQAPLADQRQGGRLDPCPAVPALLLPAR